MHKGVDPITTAKLGGWKTAKLVFDTYGQAMEDTTLAERLIGTKLTQGASVPEITEAKQRLK